MGKRLSKLIIKTWKWKCYQFPDVKKAVVIMAPHTSIYDFVWGKLFFASQNIKPVFLIKKECFFFPLGYFLKALGGFPVKREKANSNITNQAIEIFNSDIENFLLVLTPEGTRKKTKYWKKGFVRIAMASNVPIVLGYINYQKREMGVIDTVYTDENLSLEENIEKIKKIYSPLAENALRKDKFTTGYE